jgi:hypothetical protein
VLDNPSRYRFPGRTALALGKPEHDLGSPVQDTVRFPAHLDRPKRPWGSETRPSCRDLVVLVHEAAQTVPALDRRGGGDATRLRLDVAHRWRPKFKASVRPLVVVVTNVFV